MNKRTLFITAAVALLLAFVVGALFYTSQKKEESTQLVDTNSDALIRPHSPTLGNPDAPVVIVEFLDPACETCRAFYPKDNETCQRASVSPRGDLHSCVVFSRGRSRSGAIGVPTAPAFV